MELIEILSGKTTVGSACDVVESGIEEVYLIPATDDFTTFRKPFLILQFPTIAAQAQKIELEPETAQFRSSRKGNLFENLLSFRTIRQVADWLHRNRQRRYWLLLNLGKDWIISGDADMPYTMEMDYDTSRNMQDGANFSVELKSRQARPFHKWRKAIFTLNTTDWTQKTSFKGTWTSNAGMISGDYVLYQGNLYRAYPTELTVPTGTPGTSPDWVLETTYQGAWQQNGVYATNHFVLLGNALYQNNNGQNRYSISF